MNTTTAAWRPPRTCDDYWSEFKHCRRFWNQFHHYYAFGTTPSCTQWKDDYKACQEWVKSASVKAKELLQTSERRRVAEQKKFAPVWDLRQKPPEDWYLPLNHDKAQEP